MNVVHRSTRERLALAAAIAVGLVLTAVAAVVVAGDEEDERDAEFRAASERAGLVVQSRLDAAVGVHEVMRDAVAGAWPLDRTEFRDIVASRQGADPFEGVQAVSFNRMVPASMRAAFEQSVRADTSVNGVGYAGFEVTPDTTPHDDLVVVEYIEPLAGNEPAFGLDIGALPFHRPVIEEARDSGRLIATAPISLVQETGEQRGLLLMSPVYDTTRALVSGPSRRRHFVGVVVTVVRTGDLFEDAVAGDPLVDLEIYDLGRTVDAVEVAHSEDTLVFNQEGSLFAVGSDDVASRASQDINVGSRRWRLISRPASPSPPLPLASVVIALAGLLITAAIAFALWTAGRARERAEALAADRTADLRLLVASAPDATIVVDDHGLIVLASDQVGPLLGHDPADLIGQPVEILVPEMVRDRHEVHRRGFTAAPETRTMGAGLELEALRKDGRTVPVEISLSPLPGRSIGAVVASLRDVSLQREALERLKAADQMKSTFLATISHELRTPLTAIGGFAELVQEEYGGGGGDNAQFVDRILDNTAHLNRLVDDLIAFSRMENDGIALDPDVRDIRRLAEQTVKGLGAVLEGRPIIIEGPSASAFVDRVAFQRMLTNLLTNANRYSPQGAQIRITTATEGDDAVLHVDDKGPGVPVSERARVFERFWRGDIARQESVSGTGIGLAVVASLASASGGSVSVTDAAEGGARFTLRLPRQPAGGQESETGE